MDTVFHAYTSQGSLFPGMIGGKDAEEKPQDLMLSSLSLALERIALIELLGFPTDVKA